MAVSWAWWIVAGPVFVGLLGAAAAGVYATFMFFFGKD